jgi:hypothetical protein
LLDPQTGFGRLALSFIAGRFRYAVLLATALLAAPTLAVAGGGDADVPGRYAGPEVDRALAQAAEDEERRRSERLSAAARERRASSRTAYRDLAGSEARELARDRFPAAMRAPVWRSLALGQGERVRRFVGEYGAVVEAADGKAVAVDSVMPLRPEAGPGSGSLADLRLESRPGGLESRNPLVPVTFPARLSDGVAFAQDGFSISVEGAPVGTSGVVTEDRVF